MAGKDDKSRGEFLAESEDILEDLGQQLTRMDEMTESGEVDPDVVNAIFRGVHSLKGLSGMFGFEGISQLSHKLESLLDALRLGKLAISHDITSVIFAALDRLKILSEDISRGGKERSDYADVSSMIEDALSRGHGRDSKDITDEIEIDAQILKVLTEYEEHRLRENIKAKNSILLVKARFDLASFDKDLTSLNDRLKVMGEIISTLPTTGTGPDVGIEFNILVGAKEHVEKFISEISGPDVLVSVVKYKAAQRKAEPESKTVRSLSRTIRVDISRLDRIMNIVGELVLSKNVIARLSKDLRAVQGFQGMAIDLYKASRGLERKLSELQEGVIEARMVPIGQIFTRLSQAVRKYSSEVGKDIRMEMLGEDTELDKLVVEEISDPLMHLIRNAIDHGIESPQERARRGKPPRGKIRLNAYPKGNRVAISVEDDGGGIDPDRVWRKAVEKGLADPSDTPTRRNMLDLIFLPGFSTKEEVSEVSGRGVGMDVVKRNVAKLSGIIDIDTEIGKGTNITITLPITLAILKGLMVETGGEKFAMPLSAVSETLMIEPEKVNSVERREVITLRGETLPLLRLDDIFQLPREESQFIYVVVAGLAERRIGFVVDRLLGQQEVVIKSLGEKLKDLPGIAGATELGDNEVVLVLDIESLINESTKKRQTH